VAGLTLELRAGRATRSLEHAEVDERFRASRGGDIRLRLVEGSPPVPAPGSLLFDSGSVWSVHRHGSKLLYEFRTQVVDPPLYKGVVVDRRLRAGTLYLTQPRGRRALDALEYPLDELLFQHRLARDGALEVHACGVLVGTRVALFAGQSGAGKSTTARLWKRFRPRSVVLSDDRVVLRPRPRGVEAHGTPWHGEARFGSARHGRLAAVFFLRHERAVRVERLGAPESAARLFARSFPPPWDSEVMGRALATCARIAERVPCYDLGFAPGRAAVDAVHEILAAPAPRRRLSAPGPACRRRPRRGQRS
jgi:hypothetical protein